MMKARREEMIKKKIRDVQPEDIDGPNQNQDFKD